jgi:hypothetical protein
VEQQIAQYFLWGVIINAATLLVVVSVLAYALVQIRRHTREIIQQVSNVGAMTQNVAAVGARVS